METIIELKRSMCLPNGSLGLKANRWADFIEISCLLSSDGEISSGEILSQISSERGSSEERIVHEKSNYFVNGGFLYDDNFRTNETNEAQLDDNQEEQSREWFRIIETRLKLLSDWYPFTLVDEDTLELKRTLTDGNLLYIFLLLASNTRYSSKGAPFLRTAFELMSREVLALAYPNFECHVFGTTAAVDQKARFQGNITERVKTLAQELNTEITENFKNERRRDSGDAGLDIVAYLPIDPAGGETAMIPTCLGQCACSYEEWIKKQAEIDHAVWSRKLRDLPKVHEMVFVPFSIRNANGAWSQRLVTEIHTIVIDRIRFLNLISWSSNGFSWFAEHPIYASIKSLINELCLDVQYDTVID